MIQKLTPFDLIQDVLKNMSGDNNTQLSLNDNEPVDDMVAISERFENWINIPASDFRKLLSPVNLRKRILKETPDMHSEIYSSVDLTSGYLILNSHTTFKMVSASSKENEFNEIQFSFDSCCFGRYLIASTTRGICNLIFYDTDEQEVIKQLKEIWPVAAIRQSVDEEHLKVKKYFENNLISDQVIHLHVHGTKFQINTWKALLQIPSGQLMSYGGLATLLGNAGASRAAGTAIGANQIACLIPCHRVIRNDCSVGEFRWGSARKKAMIGWEGMMFRNQ